MRCRTPSLRLQVGRRGRLRGRSLCAASFFTAIGARRFPGLGNKLSGPNSSTQMPTVGVSLISVFLAVGDVGGG